MRTFSSSVAIIAFLFGSLFILPCGAAAAEPGSAKSKVLIVGSYHQGDAWSQDALKGFFAAMKTFGYFDSEEQAAGFLNNNFVETSRVIVKLYWLDARRKSTKAVLEKNAMAIYSAAKEFNPGIIFLADEEAGNYIGRLFLNSKIPVVFWGFNETPVKFGLVDSVSKPGHNITGVYQLGFDLENLRVLQKIAAQVKTFAVLADESPSSQMHIKAVKDLAQKGSLPLKLIDVFTANDYNQWKKIVLDNQKTVDAFYIVGFANLKDLQGNIVSESDIAEWYLESSKRPEVAIGYMVKMGFLCSADDTAYKQGYEAVRIAHDILSKGANPATISTHCPEIQTAPMVNAERLDALHMVRFKKWGNVQYFDLKEMD